MIPQMRKASEVQIGPPRVVISAVRHNHQQYYAEYRVHSDCTVIRFVSGFDRRITDLLRGLPKSDRYYSAQKKTWEMDTHTWTRVVKPMIERRGWAVIYESEKDLSEGYAWTGGKKIRK